MVFDIATFIGSVKASQTLQMMAFFQTWTNEKLKLLFTFRKKKFFSKLDPIDIFWLEKGFPI